MPKVQRDPKTNSSRAGNVTRISDAPSAKRQAIDKSSAKPSAALAAVLAIMVFGALFIGAYLITSVKTITVYGNSEYSDEKIINLSGLYTGRNIFLCDLSAAKKAIEKDPYLKCESVSKKLPSTIVIRVSERREFAALFSGNGAYCVIDREGCVLDVGRSQESVEGLLPVYGLGSMGFSVGTSITDDAGKLRPYTLMQILETIGDRLWAIHSIDVSNSSNVKLITSDGVTVILGDSVNIPSKIERMFIALPKIDPEKADIAVIYVNSTGSVDLSYKTPEPFNTPSPAGTPDPGSEP